jgi:hypothetical protein
MGIVDPRALHHLQRAERRRGGVSRVGFGLGEVSVDAERWASIFTWIGILGGVAVVIGGIGAWYFSREAQRQQSEATRRLTEDNERLRRDVATERERRAAVEARHAPRLLTEEDHQRFLAALTGTAGTARVVSSVDPEPADFAKQIAALLREAGWSVVEDSGAVLTPRLGVIVRLQSGTPAPGFVPQLLAALSAVSTVVTQEETPSVPPGVVEIAVGTKPP